MTPQMNTDPTEAPAGIVLTFAASLLAPINQPVWPWAVAAHEDATWRCQALGGPPAARELPHATRHAR